MNRVTLILAILVFILGGLTHLVSAGVFGEALPISTASQLAELFRASGLDRVRWGLIADFLFMTTLAGLAWRLAGGSTIGRWLAILALIVDTVENVLTLAATPNYPMALMDPVFWLGKLKIVAYAATWLWLVSAALLSRTSGSRLNNT